MLTCIVCIGGQLSAEAIATGLQISSRTVCRELHGMGFLVQAAASKTYITNCNATCWKQWDVKVAATGIQSSGGASSEVTNRASPSGNLMNKSRAGGFQENVTYLTVMC
ncbi:hypothetical protein AMECASPLE_003874 [Ameca splendens]|uniref:Uncharacterized protein n=1 Tax=Ameca splendens TaxID=208324 RepID=A0ABV0XBQ8_9TELE